MHWMGGWGYVISVGETHIVARKEREVCFEKLEIKKSEKSKSIELAFLGESLDYVDDRVQSSRVD